MPVDYERKNPIPKWLVKGRTITLKNGNIVSFAGQNKNHFCIIIKDKNDKFHVNFTIKEHEYSVHTKNEKTGKREYLLDTYSPTIIDLVQHWQKERSDLIKDFSPKRWKDHNDYVVDMNSDDLPGFVWQEGFYDVDPTILPERSIPKEDVMRLKFSQCLVFTRTGYCKGVLLPHKQAKKLIMVDRQILFNILETAIGIDNLKNVILEEYNKYKKSENELNSK